MRGEERRCQMTALVPVQRPTEDVWDVGGEMGRMFDSPYELLPQMRGREGLWHPTVDVYNRPHELIVELELPGVRMEELDVRIEENHLVLEGTRRRSEEYKEDDRYYTERLFGSFHRIIHLPSGVDADRVEARLSEGLLTIRLPKTIRAGGKRIDIKTQ
jgi:HSP20 family protein